MLLLSGSGLAEADRNSVSGQSNVGSAGEGETTSRRTAKETVRAVRNNPCAVLVAALGTDRNECSRFRNNEGTLRVSLILDAGGKKIELLQPGQRCDGGYVIARDYRVGKVPSRQTYLALKFSSPRSTGDLRFIGEAVDIQPDGSLTLISRTIYVVAGWVRLENGRWYRPDGLQGCTVD